MFGEDSEVIFYIEYALAHYKIVENFVGKFIEDKILVF